VSTVPEALTEYRAGLQLQRDDTFGRALDHFRRAAELDPGMAEAQIRVAITGWEVDAHPTEIRAALAKAVALRGRLADRDRALLDALEPIMGRSEPDEAAAIDRLQAAHERFPLDEEFLVILAELTIGDTVRGSAFARRATELDPSDGYAWEELGRGLALRGDVEGGRHALEQCAAVSVESTDCHFWLALLDRDDGRCAEMERKARRLADLDPAGYELLAQALVALGRSETSVRESVARSLASKPAARRAILQSAHDAKLAILGGRFDVAARLLSDAADGLAASPEGRSDLMNGPVAGLRIHVLAEAGSDSAARTVAREFSHRFDFPDETGRRNTYGSDLWTLRVASLPLDPRRRQWVDGQLRSGASGSGVWVLGWARPTVTAEDAKEALAALEGDARLALPRGGEAMIPLREGADAPAGHVLLLAGKAADALPYLQRASQSCDTFVEPLAHVHAQLDLGHALEALGDEPGACAAYGLVLDRWGSAKPRSVTADEARKRTQALRCETRDR
jgi:serine/threonine-protein kinase